MAPNMGIIRTLYDELISFLGIGQLLETLKSGNYETWKTLDGILSFIGPILPLILIIEIVRALLYRKFKALDYRVPLFIYIFNRFVSRFISLAVVAFCISHLSKFAILKSNLTWYWLIYGYIVWEFSHFIYHYLAHKVRLFWCLHSTHHAPQSMNLSVSFAHFFLEAPYADFIRTSICIVLGIEPALLFFIMFIDGFWGGFIHVGENLLKDGRLGFLNRIILTPSHHRVHHAQNPLYMDTNFCNLLNIWDRILGTWQPEDKNIKIEYGITRKMNSHNFLDVYFGEIVALWKDIEKAPGWRNKMLYLVKPPGWSHTGDHKTAKMIRDEFLKKYTLT
jgi:sterol desaturase/sphingolipid hydroxylase (fatty acid hydroxylase superfamily)